MLSAASAISSSFDLPVLQVVVVPYHQRFCFNIPFLYRNFSIRNTSDPDWFQLYPSDTHSAILPAFVHRVRLSIGCCCLCSSFICHSSLLQQHHIIFLCINMSHGWIKFCIFVFIGHFTLPSLNCWPLFHLFGNCSFPHWNCYWKGPGQNLCVLTVKILVSWTYFRQSLGLN